MPKRKQSGETKKNKRPKTGDLIDPGSSGVYATCNRGKEQACRRELQQLLDDYVENNEPKETLSIEEMIKNEVEELKSTDKPFQAYDLGCECLVFIKCKKMDPVQFVQDTCREAMDTKRRMTRFVQKITPVSFSASALIEELEKLAKRVLAPHFTEPRTFAIQVTRRNFNSVEKDDIIKLVAGCVGEGHKVDLKNYELLIMVECFKNNIGMSVVANFQKMERFNLQQIYEKQNGVH